MLSSNFDRATLEATVPFADRSIFVAPNGRRFLFESIPDRSESGGISGSGKGYEDGSRLSQSALASAAALRGRAPESITHTTISEDYRAANTAPIRRRPLSNTSTATLYTSSPGPTNNTQLSGDDGTEPKALTQEVAEMMGDLSINRFSATPFFTHSDGGVQAAETLTDPHPAPGLPIPQSPAMPAVTLARAPGGVSYYYDSRSTPTYTDPSYAPNVPILTSRLTNVNFDFHQPQAEEIHELEHRPSHVSVTSHVPGRQSLLEHSMPISPGASANPMLLSAPSPRAAPSFQTLHSQPGTPYAPPLSPQMSPAANYLYGLPDEPRRANGSFSYGMQDDSRAMHDIPIDTQTPVIVVESTPDPSSGSSRSDGASTNRDNVLPGEDILYDGYVD